MATSTSSKPEEQVKPNDNPLELFSLVWLDKNADVTEKRRTKKRLRAIINNFRTYQDADKCQKFIRNTSQKHRIILIISGQLGRTFVPSVHQIPQISSIYVYCSDKETHKQWAQNFAKVKGVVVAVDELISLIQDDHKVQTVAEESLSIEFFSGGTSTAELDGKFVFSQVLIDCLLKMKPRKIDQDELFSRLMDEYNENDDELANLNEFKTSYSSRKALWWYTRDSFFYKILNAALRTQNVHIMFLFRSYIVDIQNELQCHRSRSPVKVYRGQWISNEELNHLKSCPGQCISINSFFSTSLEKSKALEFISYPSKGSLIAVLFEIDADPNVRTGKPFADISKFSYFKTEAEVLFMLGSIFRLKSVTENDKKIWVVRMTLCDFEDQDLKSVLASMKRQNEDGETNLQTLGKILWNMGHFDLAEKYYCRYVNELPPNDPSLYSLYMDLSQIASQNKDYNKSMDWQKEASKHKSLPNNPTNVQRTDHSETKKSKDIDSKLNELSLQQKKILEMIEGHHKMEAQSSASRPTTEVEEKKDRSYRPATASTSVSLTEQEKKPHKSLIVQSSVPTRDFTCNSCQKNFKCKDYSTGCVVSCMCGAKFFEITCPNCQKSNITDNVRDQHDGRRWVCASCCKRFQFVRCPRCPLTYFWPNCDLSSGDRVFCDQCHIAFCPILCPHCGVANIFLASEYRMGGKATCHSCHSSFCHVTCNNCGTAAYFASFWIGQRWECQKCQKYQQFYYCKNPACQKANYFADGGHKPGTSFRCQACKMEQTQ